MGNTDERTSGREEGYRGPQACKIVGITYRQLDYWARTALVTPSLQDAQGSGSQRMYSFRDLVHLRVIKSLLDAGVTLPQIRKAIGYLDELKTPLEEVMLVSDGKTIYAATDDKTVVDLLRRGQAVFGIALGRVYEDLQGTLKQIAPGGEQTDQPAARHGEASAGSGGT